MASEDIPISVKLGTSILQKEQEKDNGQFLPIWKQEARNSQGHRRFHGAFTGGFSAGYFNTVGSKEGFQPREYKSSKSQRAEKVELKVEDFMDEEDLEDLKNSKTIVAANSKEETKKVENWREQQLDNLKNLPNPVGEVNDSILELFVDGKADSIGITILKQMGWKSNSNIKSNNNNNDLNQSTFLISSEIKPKIYFQSKPNQGLNLNHYKLNQPSPSLSKLEYLESTNKIDEVYNEDRNKRNMNLVVENSDSDEDKVVLKRNRRRPPPPPSSSQINKTKENDIKLSVGIERNFCHDGRKPLPKFKLAFEPFQDKVQLPIPVPDDFNPRHTFKEPRLISTTLPNQWNATTRSLALGETLIQDYLKKKEMERIKSIKKMEYKKEELILNDNMKYNLELMLGVAMLDKNTAAIALDKFENSTYSEDKKIRYIQFLKYFKKESRLPPLWPKDMKDKDKVEEIKEFQKMAQIHGPLNSLMASRFVKSSGQMEIQNQLKVGLTKNEELVNYNNNKDHFKPSDVTTQTITQIHQTKSHGTYIRRTDSFFPNRLLCKRFNVSQPIPTSSPSQLSSKTTTHSTNYQRTMQASQTELLDLDNLEKRLGRKIDEIKEEKIIKKEEITLSEEKPEMELFKLVFDSDED